MLRSIWFVRICYCVALSALLAMGTTLFDERYASALWAVVPCFILSLFPYVSSAWCSRPYNGPAIPAVLSIAGIAALLIDRLYPTTYGAGLGIFLIGAGVQFAILNREVRLRAERAAWSRR